MAHMPRSGRLYVLIMSIAGLLILALSVGDCLRGNTREVMLFIALTTLAALARIELALDKGTMSVAFALVFSTMLRFGPCEGAVAAGVSGIFATLVSPEGYRQPLYRFAFNGGSLAIAGLLAGLAYSATGGNFADESIEKNLVAMGIATLVYYLVNTFSVATAIGLTVRLPIYKTWKDSFVWTAPGYFAGASCAVIINKFYGAWGPPVFLVVLPVLYLTYYSYKVYTEKARESTRHIEDLRAEQQKLTALYLSTVESLAIAIDAKDQYTHDHIRRVQRYAVETALELGITGDDLEGIRTAALLHDIGKLGVPEHILSKPGNLTEEERRKIQDHCTTGAKILEPVNFPWPVAQIVRSHHEKYDGTGYPDGLRGNQIPLGARVMAVADVFDALTSDRPYRLAMSRDKALETIQDIAGSMFDPAVVFAFSKVVVRVSEELDQEQHEIADHQAPQTDNQSALAENCRPSEPSAFEDIARANQEILALYEIAQTVGTNLNLSETLTLVVSKLGKIIPFSGCAILLLDKDRDEFRAEIACGTDSEQLWKLAVSRGVGFTGNVVATGTAYISPDNPGPELHGNNGQSNSLQLNSTLIVPLIAGTDTIGTINLYHEFPGFFTEDHLRLLNIIAKQAAAAIQNAVLFQATRESAMTDSLTGLANARYLFTFLEQEISRAVRSNHPLSLLVMDLDDFKPINDQYGHASGDKVLRDLADIFKAQLRDYDAVARYAGDEFIVIMPAAGSTEAEAAAERIRTAVDSYTWEPYAGRQVHVGISIGISTYPRDGLDSSTLIAVADTRMYEDKRHRKSKAGEEITLNKDAAA